jgi:hypothetical protein
MYPLRDNDLMLSRLATEWAQEMPARPTEPAIMTILLQAVWQRELCALHLDDRPTYPDDLLRLVPLAEHPGFEIYADGQPDRIASVELPDGGLEVHFNRYVVLPADLTDLSAEQRQFAIEELSVMQFDDFSDTFREFVRMLRVTREEFGRYCDLAGYPRPYFWFGKAKAKVKASNAKSEGDCAKWLRSLAQDKNRRPKSWYLDEALRRFPNLSERGFNRAWARSVPATWRKKGRKGKRGAAISGLSC